MIAENKERLVYSVYDLVDLLGLSISSVYKGINDNEIPHVRVGGRILIPKKMLDEWLSKRESQATEAIKKCKLLSSPIFRYWYFVQSTKRLHSVDDYVAGALATGEPTLDY